MIPSVDDHTALEEVLGFLDRPPVAGSSDDARFGERLRQVLAASLHPDEEEPPARLTVRDDLRRRIEAVAMRRTAAHPFGEHPDGIGPTLGMHIGRH